MFPALNRGQARCAANTASRLRNEIGKVLGIRSILTGLCDNVDHQVPGSRLADSANARAIVCFASSEAPRVRGTAAAAAAASRATSPRFNAGPCPAAVLVVS